MVTEDTKVKKCARWIYEQDVFVSTFVSRVSRCNFVALSLVIIRHTNYLYNKRRYVCLSVCLSVSMFRMAGQTAGPIDTKLDTRTSTQGVFQSRSMSRSFMYACGSDRITKHPERCAKPTPGERLRNSSGGRVITATTV